MIDSLKLFNLLGEKEFKRKRNTIGKKLFSPLVHEVCNMHFKMACKSKHGCIEYKVGVGSMTLATKIWHRKLKSKNFFYQL